MRRDVIEWVQPQLEELAVEQDAGPMQAYMKTEQPFYGVKRPLRKQVERELFAEFPPADAADWRDIVLTLWGLPHREERYIAIEYAKRFKRFHDPAALTMGLRMVREGAWWDLVDALAIHVVGSVLRRHRDVVQSSVEALIDNEDLWLRRTALYSQMQHKRETDEALLFRLCLARSHETEFFIRKAIGCALRTYARTAPERVATFVVEHRERWSGLTWREATRHLSV